MGLSHFEKPPTYSRISQYYRKPGGSERTEMHIGYWLENQKERNH
jgi:hypothetical protein